MKGTVLVTGGAGFIGSWVCKHLLQEGYRIVNLDKLTYAANLSRLGEIQDNQRYRFAQGDIADLSLVRKLLVEGEIDAVINLAAESHVDRSISAPAPFVDTNVVGTLNLLRAASDYFDQLAPEHHERFRFIHVSTDEVFGSLGPEGHFHEETRYNPTSPYAASKAASDHLVSAFHHTYGLPTIITNCSNNYGPYQFPEKLIPLSLLNALEHQRLPVYGRGTNVRDWLHVADHVRALVLVLEKGRPGDIYNIGGRTELENIEVVQMICRLLQAKGVPAPAKGFESLITFVTDRPGHDLRYAIDCHKIEHELGWRTEWTFETGLSDTVDWYLANEEWWRPIRQKEYGGERLGICRTSIDQ